MGKMKVYKGRESVRAAMRILNHSTRFIILADDENGHDLPLYCAGYPAESAVADQLLKVGVAMLRRHRQEREAAAAEAGLPTADEGRPVDPFAELVLPAGAGAPPAFGTPDRTEGEDAVR